jgi:CRP/FNR family cyclic AMP-dependent transcriptional regulator
VNGDVPLGSFLGSLDDADRMELESAGRRMTLPKGTLLFEGDTSGRVALILDGTARVFATATNGREVLVTVVGPGEILGEMAALDGHPHSASVTALDDVVAVLIPTTTFRSILLGNARVATAVATRLTRELRRVMHQRVDLEAYEVPARLASVLVELHDRFARGDGPVELPVSQRELAEWCGASREAVTKAMATFRDRGWVRTRRGTVMVDDVDALRARAS